MKLEGTRIHEAVKIHQIIRLPLKMFSSLKFPSLRTLHRCSCLFFCAAMLVVTTTFAATTGGTLQRLDQFLQVQAFRAAFSQVIYDAKRDVVGNSTGTVLLVRPGRFRWEYAEPANQTIVSDGTNLIVYDPDLGQASVQPVFEALGDAPITLLLGYRPVFDRFEVNLRERRAGLDWIALTPKVKDIEFTEINLGLDGERVVRMELFDHFEQTTVINFSRFDLNPDVAADAFRLSLPDTVDVIGEYLPPAAP